MFSQNTPASTKDYNTLRKQQGFPGDFISINREGIAGKFGFSITDPFGNGDDNGIIITAPNGWWIRQFHHSRVDPIRLDWFQLSPGDEISFLLKTLAKNYSPYLYLKMPSKPLEIFLDYINLTGTTRYLYFLKGHPEVTINQIDSPQNTGTMLRLDNYHEVLIESGITFIGRHDLFGGTKGYKTGTRNYKNMGLLTFNLNHFNANFFKIYCNITNSPNFGLNHTGGTINASRARTKNADIGGVYNNSGIRINSGIKNLHVDNVHILDPTGKGLGWDKVSQKSNILNYEKHHGMWMQNISILTGSLLLEYGNATWFMSNNEKIGSSIQDPFVVEDKSMGWLSLSRRIPQTRGIRTQTGKIDALFNSAKENQRFIKLISDGKNKLQYPFLIEATPENKYDYYSNNIHIELENIHAIRPVIIGEINQNRRGAIGHVQGNKITGTADQLVIYDSNNSIYNLTAKNIFIKRHPKQSFTRPDNINLTNVTLVQGGVIIIESGQNIIMDGLIVKGSAREVIRINNMKEAEYVQISIKNLHVPAGSTITSDRPSLVKVSLNGSPISLPYLFIKK